MEVEYALTRDDLIAFRRFHRSRSLKANKLLIVKMLLLLLFALIALASISDKLGVLPASDAIVITAITGIILTLLFIPFYAYEPRLHADNFIRLHGSNKVLNTCRQRATPEGFASESSMSVGLAKWSAIHEIAVTSDHLFIYTTPGYAVIVPRRAFADEQKFGEFASAVQRHYQDSRSALVESVQE